MNYPNVSLPRSSTVTATPSTQDNKQNNTQDRSKRMNTITALDKETEQQQHMFVERRSGNDRRSQNSTHHKRLDSRNANDRRSPRLLIQI